MSLKLPCQTIASFEAAVSGRYGSLFCADSLELLPHLPDASFDLIVTSPPYALVAKREYGNPDQEDYIDWLLPFTRECYRLLKPGGSFVLNIGNAYEQGRPVMSLVAHELILRLCREQQWLLLQELFYVNMAPPLRGEWEIRRKIRMKSSVEYVFWLGKQPYVKVSTERCMTPKKRKHWGHAEYERHPCGYTFYIKHKERYEANPGSLPGNYLVYANADSNSDYFRYCRKHGYAIHPARFVEDLPRFFMHLTTDPGDTVLDLFAGAATTGVVAERLERFWLCIEQDSRYIPGAAFRIKQAAEAGPYGRPARDHYLIYRPCLLSPTPDVERRFPLNPSGQDGNLGYGLALADLEREQRVSMAEPAPAPEPEPEPAPEPGSLWSLQPTRACETHLARQA